jgi:hypothetical protein
LPPPKRKTLRKNADSFLSEKIHQKVI